MQNFWHKIKKQAEKENRPILALAPMAGYTDLALRLLCKEYGADVVYTEMVSVNALYHNSEKTIKMLNISKKERPVVVQLFGNNPKYFAKAAKMVEQKGASGIDINFGCPVPKIMKSGGGIDLFKNLDLSYQVIKTTIDAVKIPVSVKTRISVGKGKDQIHVLDFIDKVKDLDIKAIMIHGRTFEQRFLGQVDYSVIKKAKKRFKGIVLANGGIKRPEDVLEMIKNTQADGVGLAQGVIGKPYLFKQVIDFYLKNKYQELNVAQIKKLALKHAKIFIKFYGQNRIMELRKQLLFYFKDFPEAKSYRKEIIKIETLKDIEKICQ